MTFVIAQTCCNDASCVAVCPVQCIRPRPGDRDFTTTEQLHIDPSSCIDCGACATACPVEAIHHHTSLPGTLTDFNEINAEYFASHPLQHVTPPSVLRRRLPVDRPNLAVAIVGAGPSGLYAAAELSEIVGASVTVVEKLPTPYGLVRAGVAPDHDGTKLVGERFADVLRRPNVRCLFNIDVGRDMTIDELLEHHHAVLWAAGAPDDRTLGIAGENLAGSVSARELVCWYNGHPYFADRQFGLSSKRVVVIGNGNVALDIARILARPSAALESTSMSDLALAALRASEVEEVMVVGRRSQAHAAYSTAELLALSTLPGVDLLARPGEVAITDQDLALMGSGGPATTFARRRAIIDAAAARTPIAPRRIVMRYGLTPMRLVGERSVEGIVLRGLDGLEEVIETSLVVRAIGFRGRPVPGLPFDGSAGIIPNDAGRVVDPVTRRRVPGVYCTGWIKRGPTGVIGTNRTDSAETVASLLEDLHDGRLQQPSVEPERLVDCVRKRQPELVESPGWERIDELERGAGRASGRPRVNMLNVDEMIRVALNRTT